MDDGVMKLFDSLPDTGRPDDTPTVHVLCAEVEPEDGVATLLADALRSAILGRSVDAADRWAVKVTVDEAMLPSVSRRALLDADGLIVIVRARRGSGASSRR